LETHKVPHGGQRVDVNIESQKYDKEHQVATRWSHVEKMMRVNGKFNPRATRPKVDGWKHGKIYNSITLVEYVSN
jgi:hypothetical protein